MLQIEYPLQKPIQNKQNIIPIIQSRRIFTILLSMVHTKFQNSNSINEDLKFHHAIWILNFFIKTKIPRNILSVDFEKRKFNNLTRFYIFAQVSSCFKNISVDFKKVLLHNERSGKLLQKRNLINLLALSLLTIYRPSSPPQKSRFDPNSWETNKNENKIFDFFLVMINFVHNFQVFFRWFFGQQK